MNLVNLNGTFQAGNALLLRASNSALRYGFGLFETMLLLDRRLCLATYHWERLFSGLEKLNFNLPAHFTPDRLEQEVLQTVRKNGLERSCRVRLEVFTELNGLSDNDKRFPQFLIECSPLEKAAFEWNENGWICGIAENISKAADTFSNLKTCNTLPYIMAAQQAKEHQWNDALIVNAANNILESTIANIFWVKDENLYTPPLHEGCVAGIMRRHLIAECYKRNIPVIEAALNYATLASADEVFLTNAIRRIKWVKEVGGAFYPNPSFSRAIHELLFSP